MRQKKPVMANQLLFPFAEAIQKKQTAVRKAAETRKTKFETGLQRTAESIRPEYLQKPERAQYRIREIDAQLNAISPSKQKSGKAQALRKTRSVLNEIQVNFERQLAEQRRKK